MCKLDLFSNKRLYKIQEELDHTNVILSLFLKEIKKMAVNMDALNTVVADVVTSIDAASAKLDALEVWVKANPNTDPTTTAALQAVQDTLTAAKAKLDTAVANAEVPTDVPPVG